MCQTTLDAKPHAVTSHLEPLFLRERVAVVHLLALAGASAKHLLLLLLAGQPLDLSVVFQNPAGQVVLLHQTGLPLGVASLLATSVQIHALE